MSPPSAKTPAAPLPPVGHPRPVNAAVLEAAARLAEHLHASAVLADSACFDCAEAVHRLAETVPVVLVRREGQPEPPGARAARHVLNVSGIHLTRMGQIKLALLSSMGRGLFRRGETVVCLSGSYVTNQLDTLMVIEIGEEHEMLVGSESQDLTQNVSPEVFDKVLDVAIQLANEGREGKPIGTLLVLGDEKEVAHYTEQLIINPFRGYPEDERNILDPNLTDTVKELAAIDGAFIIRGDGTILSAGTYLKPALAGEDLPSGLGARHAAAASLSASTAALVFTVSESTGTVRVFRDGRIITEIERPVRPG
jgi:DNA integrity scanning protein DisA with diadenylate cyclase activity